MRRFAALAAVLLAAVLASETASAQEQTWLSDRRYREGPGFLVGDWELHPGLGAEFGFDSNYFRRGPAEDPVRALRIRISPSFSVSTLGPQRREPGDPPPDVDFRADLTGAYNEFIPVSGTDQGKEAMADQRNFAGDLGLSLGIMPQRTWSGRLHAGIGRSMMPTNEADPSVSYNRLRPSAGAEVIWTPGGGMLDWRLGYEFHGTIFEAGDFSELNRLDNYIVTRGRWRFFPRTAMLYDMKAGFLIYPDQSVKTNSYPLRTRIGVNGLITPSFAAMAMAGWGSSFYAGEQEDFDSVLAQLEVKWYLTPVPGGDPMQVTASLSSIAAGFIRDFDDSYIGTYFERDRGYLKFSYLFGGVFLLVAEGGAGAVVFPAVPTNANYVGQGAWTDVAVDGSLFAEYRIKDMWGINTSLRYMGYFSDTVLTFTSGAGADQLKYQRFEAFLGGRWFM
ncbi:MAG: hypothetical protein JRI23_22135 [Deltaproteobacteria bacterium]|jgi:hypothetical protein|nr:hypothetical protein [Deltaproteobacteria bacterium]MBW2534659.1 hypothetical protein [Deltaproteobacteria bacterium]